MKAKKYLNFEKAAAPYLNAWDEWIVSDYCFLDHEEAIIVSSYLRLKSIRSVSLKVNRSEQTVSKKIHAIYRKLLFGIRVYQSWEKDRKEDDLYPLNVPVSCLNAPVKLKHLLNQLGDNLGEILKEYTREKLKKLKGWGTKTINDLHRILDLYGYSHLLRITELAAVECTTDRIVDGKKTPRGDYLKQDGAMIKLYRGTMSLHNKAEESERPNLNFLLPVSGKQKRKLNKVK